MAKLTFNITDRKSMIDLGGRIYDRVAVSLRTKGGALEAASEILRELSPLADLISSSFAIAKLDILDCKGTEVRTIVAIHTLKDKIMKMELLMMSPLQLACLDDALSVELITEVWLVRALACEAYRAAYEFATSAY